MKKSSDIHMRKAITDSIIGKQITAKYKITQQATSQIIELLNTFPF